MTDTYVVPMDRVASRVLDGEAVVINLESGVYVGLNGTATAIWQQIEAAPRSVDALAAALASAYGAAPGEVEADVRFFLEILATEGLVSADGDPTPVDGIVGDGPYLAPMAERYESLDELMLSGE